eukprot:1145524-Pelagomonas_calceolata.AAC.1
MVSRFRLRTALYCFLRTPSSDECYEWLCGSNVCDKRESAEGLIGRNHVCMHAAANFGTSSKPCLDTDSGSLFAAYSFHLSVLECASTSNLPEDNGLLALVSS